MMETAIFLVALVTLVSAEFSHDHCDRHASLCSGRGECNINTGACKCESAYTGANCQITVSSTQNCNANCENDGTCYRNDGNEEKCLCAIGFYGSNCIFTTPTLTCSVTGMTLISMVSAKPAAIYPAQTMDETCIISLQNVIAILPFSRWEECGVTVNDIGDRVEKQVDIIFQYRPGLLRNTDEIYHLTCTYDKVTSVLISSQIKVSRATNNLVQFNGKADGTVNSESLVATVKVGDKVTNEANEGAVVSMTIALTDNTIYKKIKVMDCRIEGKDQAPIPIVANGCVLSVALLKDLSRTDEKSVDVSVIAQHYFGSTVSTWTLTCDVRVCVDTNDCAATTCDLDLSAIIASNGHGRRRRTEHFGVEQVSVRYTITSNDTSVPNQKDSSQPWAVSQMHLVVIMVVIGAAILLAIITCLWFRLRMGMKRKEQIILVKD